ncbi:MAG TPA: hypothetical protein VN253_18330 [Kofleriaceae bacterium]|nr:hypothetical protein [Kofleriaceae bacterium]
MNHYLVSTTFVLSTALAACGGGPLDPGAGNDPGNGTSTLLIDGQAIATPQLSNARSAADFETSFSVRITLAGQTVSTGTVSVTSAGGTVPLTFNNGRWEGVGAGYDEVYRLDVESGADNARSIRVDGPDIHTFTAPAPGAVVDAPAAIDLTWSRDDEAESASLRTEQIDELAVPDSGRYQLPPNALKSERDKPHENTIRIRRQNRVVPSGAVGGSEWRVRIDNSIQVLANPNPNA